MPAATPIPRGPSVLILYSAADLLTRPGCPVCRYAGEASDRYFSWFALEGHAQTVTITRLCASLGMCARHTRGLLTQPGAAPRLTAVNRYLVQAARDQLTGRSARLAECPACEHDDAAAARALDTLLDELPDPAVQQRYRELGGLCIPHLRTAIGRARRRLPGWLADQVTVALAAPPPPGPGWLTGIDHDAAARVQFRNALPARVQPGADGCAACLAAAHAERHDLAVLAQPSIRRQPDHRQLLCAGHLSDLAVLVGQDNLRPLLAWQAGCLAAVLCGGRDGWLPPWRKRSSHPVPCAVCLHSRTAARQALGELRAAVPEPGLPAPLCVRHVLALRAADPSAGQVAVPCAAAHADRLIAELSEAFRKNTWASRQEPPGPEMTAWRRAAAFLDGGVFCGAPPSWGRTAAPLATGMHSARQNPDKSGGNCTSRMPSRPGAWSMGLEFRDRHQCRARVGPLMS